jgi:thiamine-phosphate pyrophosphorylase
MRSMSPDAHRASEHLLARLERARLYLVCDGRPGGAEPERFLSAALAGGVDVVQLRDKIRDDQELATVAGVFRRLCDEHGALFLINDRPDLAGRCGADGVHIGQDDVPVARARASVGPGRLVGLSTHAPGEVDRAGEADYIGVGPVHATPTKPGRPAVGLDLVRHAAAHAPVPFFAIGGIDASNVGAVLAAGASRVAVVRAITEAADPESAARALRERVMQSVDDAEEASVGTT